MSHFISTIEQLQDAGLSIDNDTDLDVIDPHLRDAEKAFVKPVLGSTLWDAVIAGLAAPTPDAKWTDLLPYLQKPTAFHGYFRFFKISRGQLNHRGFSRDRSEYSEAAPKWEIDEIKTNLICQADFALDELISFLVANKATYTEWLTSDFFEQSVGTVIPTADIFHDFVPIGCSGRVFARLKQYRVRAERALVRTICSDLYNQVITEVKTTVSPEVTALLPYLRAVVAYDTMAKGIKMMNFNYLENGIYLYSFNDGTISKTAISTADSRMLAEQWAHDYNEARAELISFLKENIEDYPAYASSSCYESQPASLISRYTNQIERKHWGL